MPKCYVKNRIDPSRLNKAGLGPCPNEATTMMMLPWHGGSSHPVCDSCAVIANTLLIPLFNRIGADLGDPPIPSIVIVGRN